MSNKFGSLVADVSKAFRVEIVDPVTEEVIRDKAGNPMFIAIWAADSARARDFGKAKRKELALRVKQSRNGKVEPDDALEANIAFCAALTDGWYLVDRVTGEPIDVPCTPENAADLYSSLGAGWIFIQPWTEANSAANFLPKPSKPSVDTPKPSSEAEGA
ncbi:hypothetical protein IVB03_27830 [Bradyrhizobium sp. 168]|uniref:hypothetical protein n=1 Tax=Bradyrhizobium sp. 168 TaxID=2782639 RepID=UPI001FFAB420|nr:hypothetical protein [Bradyrhizobium sp. 168]MCK1583270.1 hypothetical protein [Bradyrhizobium sp. 168]